jgi:hypothetical protein
MKNFVLVCFSVVLYAQTPPLEELKSEARSLAAEELLASRTYMVLAGPTPRARRGKAAALSTRWS